MEFFATAAKGIEELPAEELRALGITVTAVESGGVRFAGEMVDCWRANLWLRTANRVLMPLTSFPCETPQELYDGVRSIPWSDYLTPAMTLAVDCSLRASAMTHSGFVALKTKDAIVDQIRDRCGSRPSVDTHDPDLRVNVHLVKNLCTVSLDSSGTPLDRRGYRLERTEAPLRETLAAALVAMSGRFPLVEAYLRRGAREGAPLPAGPHCRLRPVGSGARNCSAERREGRGGRADRFCPAGTP